MRYTRLSMLGLSIHSITATQLMSFVKECVQSKRQGIAAYLNIHGAVLAAKKPWLRDFYNRADLLFCDGDGVRWGLRLLGYCPPPKLPLTRKIVNIAELCAQEGFRLFLLGGKLGIAEQASRKLTEKFPKLQIAGIYHGHFAKQGVGNEKVIDLINQAKTDVLVVGFGSPLQEQWIFKNKERIRASVLLPSGAVLDWVSGYFRQAPQWMIDAHLEWLYRIVLEPGRLLGRYASEIPYFFGKVLQERFFTLRRPRK